MHWSGHVTASVHPWRRWRMRGQTAAGEPNWLAAWRTGSWAALERHAYAVVLRHRAEPIIKVATEAL